MGRVEICALTFNAMFSTVQQQPSSFVGGQVPLPEPHVIVSAETLSTIPIRRSCKIIIECLKTETDWTIVQLVLKELPSILQNKALLRGIDMDTLAISVINLVKVRNRVRFGCGTVKFACISISSIKRTSIAPTHLLASNRICRISSR